MNADQRGRLSLTKSQNKSLSSVIIGDFKNVKIDLTKTKKRK